MPRGTEYISRPVYDHDTGKVNHVDAPGIKIDIAERFNLVSPHPLMNVHIAYDFEVNGMDIAVSGISCTYKDKANGTFRHLYKIKGIETVLANLFTKRHGVEYTVTTMRKSFVNEWQAQLQYLNKVYEHTVAFEIVFRSSIPYSMTAVEIDRGTVNDAIASTITSADFHRDTDHYKHVNSVEVKDA